MSDVYVLGAASHPPAYQHDALRLEELVYGTARLTLDRAGVSRRELDHVTLGGSDELDGRPISSMLLAAPAGAFLTDETRVTDSAATALCLATARIASGDFDLGLVVGWCKTSKTDVDEVMNARAEPFYLRSLGLSMTATDGLLAQAVATEWSIDEDEVANRVVAAHERAAANPRGLGRAVPEREEIAGSAYEATPLRAGHRAPLSDGAAGLVLASDHWLKRNPQREPLARIAGIGWASDAYRLDGERLRSFRSARTAWKTALDRAGCEQAADLDVVELESQTGFHEAAYARVFGLADEQISPSGGPFAQNPLFCTGLVNAVEAVLQVSGGAGPVQRPGARWAAAHGCHGYAQQGNVVVVFEGGVAHA